MINKETGEPFKAADFHIGFVASLPSVSLEVGAAIITLGDVFSYSAADAIVVQANRRHMMAASSCGLVDISYCGEPS